MQSACDERCFQTANYHGYSNAWFCCENEAKSQALRATQMMIIISCHAAEEIIVFMGQKRRFIGKLGRAANCYEMEIT